MDYRKLCISCMHEKKDAYDVCEKCGFDPRSYHIPSQALVPFAILNGKYLTGKVLGIGGFGIAYIAYDMNLQRICVVKEFFVRGSMYRLPDLSMQVRTDFNGDWAKEEYCKAAREKFVHEARVLAHLEQLPGISLSVYDYFEENSTAYMVMDYLNGKTLKQYRKEKGGKLSFTEVIEKMSPVIQSLQKLHEKRILHRDISPENLMVHDDGSISLIDFGSAYDGTKEGNDTRIIMVKPGYSPIEQYAADGEIGPWTDVYAMAATIYYSICGVVLPESTKRVEGQNSLIRQNLESVVPELPTYLVNTILKGVEIKKEDRYPDMRTFWEALYEEKQTPEVLTGPQSDEDESSPKHPFLRRLAVSIIAIALGTIIGKVGGSLTAEYYSTPTSIAAPKTDRKTVDFPYDDTPIGEIIKFGTYPQETENPQEIEWYVADKKDGKVLLISKYILDYAGEHESDHWVNSKIRTWLNQDDSSFINMAFEDYQIGSICLSTIDNDSRKDLEDQEGAFQGVADPETEDRIFLLSRGEEKTYLENSAMSGLNQHPEYSIPTEYAVSHGVSVNRKGYGGSCTRSFTRNGRFWISYTDEAPGDKSGVRPAMWVYTGEAFYDEETVKEAQEQLKRRGYSCGTQDGILDARTVQSLKNYQKAHNLPANGILTPDTFNSLIEE